MEMKMMKKITDKCDNIERRVAKRIEKMSVNHFLTATFLTAVSVIILGLVTLVLKVLPFFLGVSAFLGTVLLFCFFPFVMLTILAIVLKVLPLAIFITLMVYSGIVLKENRNRYKEKYFPDLK
jgi:uncharacterized Tic20 family protein